MLYHATTALQHLSLVVKLAWQSFVHDCSLTLSNEELLELIMAGKLTFSIAKATAQGRAQKWLGDKLKPKESLIHIGKSDVPGADLHVFTVRHLVLDSLTCHTFYWSYSLVAHPLSLSLSLTGDISHW